MTTHKRGINLSITLSSLRRTITRMSLFYKFLAVIALLIMLINFKQFYVSTHEHEGVHVGKRSITIDKSVRREYQELQRLESEFQNKVFHGNDAVKAILRQKNLVDSIAEKNIKRLKEEQKAHTTDANDWILCSNSKQIDDRFWPTVGNGHLATVVRGNTVYMNGLYNGKGTSTHRARIPAFTTFVLTNASPPVAKVAYCLNMQTGIYTEDYNGDHWSLRVSTYAHRNYTRLLVSEIVLQTDGQQAVQVHFEQNQGPPSSDLDLKEGKAEFVNSRYTYGSIVAPEVSDKHKTPIHIHYSNNPPSFDIPSGTSNTFKKIYLMAASPFLEEATASFQRGLDMYNAGTLEKYHTEAWQKVWEAGRIDINGNSMLAKSAHSTLYYLLSAIPTVKETTWPFIGLSPGDLAHGAKGKDYTGHVFWDQDTWMYPPLLVLNADLGKTLVQTRLRTLDKAYVNAHLRGLEGAMYPWESAFEGLNVSPYPPTTIYEIHVTGDVAYGFQQYLMMTRDKEFLRSSRLKEAIGAMADFWQSRVSYNDRKDRYEILKLMPPDEWNWPVNNSVYTNQLVKMSLLLPKYAYSLIGEEAPKKYEDIAQKMFILEDDKLKYHPEYEGYNLSVAVKQADVVLLGFPLNMPMSKEFRLNDLTFYEKTTPGGPAMTWGMFAIGWIELGQPEKAESLFKQQLLNQQEPFNVWTEDATGEGAINFITGQGGFLQSIIFGYAGLRMTTEHIEMKCTSFPNADSFIIKNMDYLGNSLDIFCSASKTEVTLTISSTTPLTLLAVQSGKKYNLQLGKTFSVPNQKLIISGQTS